MRAFFLDIDGTITMPGRDPSPRLSCVIRQLQKQGDRVFLCTGRNECMVPDNIKALNCDGGIYSAGGRIIIGSMEIFDSPISTDGILEFLPIIEKTGINFTLECKSNAYKFTGKTYDFLKKANIWDKLNSEFQRFIMEDSNGDKILPYRDYTGEPVYKIVVLPHEVNQMRYLKENLPAWANLIEFHNFAWDIPLETGEISVEGITKGHAIEKVCDYYGMDTKDAVAIGDSMNDEDAITTAGIGIAMGNSVPELKAIADRVCDSCEHDGLAKVLEEFCRG